MESNLLPKIEAFIVLIVSLLEDITLPNHERLEHLKLQRTLEDFALLLKGKGMLEESPINLARSLFVQIYRMSLTRGRQAVFLGKADEIEREASRISCGTYVYLDREELEISCRAITYYEHCITPPPRDKDSEPINRVSQKLSRYAAKIADQEC